jgi:hypothetical protein
MRRNRVKWFDGLVMLGGLMMLGGLAGLSVMAGCAGYGNYSAGDPDSDSGYRALDSPNSPQMSEVIRRAMVAAVDRSGIDEPYAVRLPAAMDQTRCERVLAELNDHNARLAVGEGASGLPEFTVERAIVRFNRAEVDVAIPMTGVDWPDGTPARQLTTYYLKSGFGRWSVTRMRTWSIGVNERAIAEIEDAGATPDAVVEEEATKGAGEPPF